MKKLVLAVYCFLVIISGLKAQSITEWINSKKPVLFEKVYLHVDREYYAPGDLIWFKIYQVNGLTHKPNTNYRNVFVQLVDENGHIVRNLTLFTINGQAGSQLKTDGLSRGMYTIRAYTKYLENYGEEAFFHKNIWITQSIAAVNLAEKDQADFSKIDLSLLPEGGQMVLHAVNTIAFKAVDQNGKGIYVSGKIRNEKGDTLATFRSEYLGMGRFNLMPEAGSGYFATIDQNPELKIKLPEALEHGISLNYKENRESLLFGMLANMKQDVLPEFYFAASHKGIILFYKKIAMADFTQSLHLSKSLFPKGVSKITLLDLSLNPFAERLIFVDDEAGDNIKMEMDRLEFTPRDSVQINLEALLAGGDSIQSGLSVSVVNKNYFSRGGNNQTIRSYLLLDSELKGAIESPDSYFRNDETMTSAEKLDLLMLVHGWRSYEWDDVELSPPPPLADWNDAGINLYGMTKKLMWDTPLPGARVTLGLSRGDFLFLETHSDSLGFFEFRNIYLRDSSEIVVDARTKKGTRNTRVFLEPLPPKDSLVSPEVISKTVFPIDLHKQFVQDNYYRRMKEIGYNPEKGSILLSEVEVLKDRIIKDDGHIRLYSRADNVLKVTSDDTHFQNVLDYLEGKVGGLTIVGDQISIRGGKMPLFLLDGVEISDFPPGSGNVLNEVKHIPMKEIEKVEVLKSGANLSVYGSRGVDGVIAIFRKTTGDAGFNPNANLNGRLSQRINGFERFPRFYSPRYTLENRNDPMPDYRPTLFWNPEVNLSDGKASLKFFTCDELANYVVFVEGITKSGKICFGTTSFFVDKK